MTISGLFTFCAILGGTIMILQLAFSLLGFGLDDAGDAVDFSPDVLDTDIDDAADALTGHDSAHFEIFRILSFKTLLAGVTFFGLSGLAGLAAGLHPALATVIALVVGFLAIYAVYWIYKKISSIRSDGTVTAKSLVGTHGKVYIRIPANHSGAGKIQINQQDRTMEYEAFTTGKMLPSGTEIVVTRVISSTSVEVEPG
jgi:membrane protein implicated in regulation of membrane protease activity